MLLCFPILIWQKCTGKSVLNVNGTRKLIEYLISLASCYTNYPPPPPYHIITSPTPMHPPMQPCTDQCTNRCTAQLACQPNPNLQHWTYRPWHYTILLLRSKPFLFVCSSIWIPVLQTDWEARKRFGCISKDVNCKTGKNKNYFSVW